MSFRGRYPTRFRRSDNFQRTKRSFYSGRGHSFKRQSGEEHNLPPLRGGRGGFKDHFNMREFEPVFQDRGRSKGRRPFKKFRGSNIRSPRSRFFKGRKPLQHEQRWVSPTHFDSEFRSLSVERERFSQDWSEEERYLDSRYEEGSPNWRSRSPEDPFLNKDERIREERDGSYDRRSRSPLIIHRRFGVDDGISRQESLERVTPRSFDETCEHRSERILHSKSLERRSTEACERISHRSLERRSELSHGRRSEHSYGRLSPARSFYSTSNRSFERLTERNFEKHEDKLFDRISHRSRSIERRFEDPVQKSDQFDGRSTNSLISLDRRKERFYEKRHKRLTDRSEISLKSVERRSQSSFVRGIGYNFDESPCLRDVSLERDKHIHKDVYDKPFSRSVSPNGRIRNYERTREHRHESSVSTSPRRKPTNRETFDQMLDYKDRSLERSLSPVRRSDSYTNISRASLAQQINYERRRNQMLEHEKRFHEKRSESSIERFLDNCKKSVEEKLEPQTDIPLSPRHDERHTLEVQRNTERYMAFDEQPRTFRGLDHITFQRGNSLEKTIYNEKKSNYFKSKNQAFHKVNTQKEYHQQLSPISLEGSLGNQEMVPSQKTTFKAQDLSPVSQPGSFEKREFSEIHENQFDLSPISLTENFDKRGFFEGEDMHVNDDMELSSISQTSSDKRVFSKKKSVVLPGLSPISHTESFEDQHNGSGKLFERPKSTDSMQQFLAELERSYDGSQSSGRRSRSPYTEIWKSNNEPPEKLPTSNRLSEINRHQLKGLQYASYIGYNNEKNVKENSFMLDCYTKRFEREPKTFQYTDYSRKFKTDGGYKQLIDKDRILTSTIQSYQQLDNNTGMAVNKQSVQHNQHRSSNNREIITLTNSWNDQDKQLASSMKQTIANYQGLEKALENQSTQFSGSFVNESSYQYPKFQQSGIVHNQIFNPLSIATTQSIPSGLNQGAQFQPFPGLPNPNIPFYQGVLHSNPNYYNQFPELQNANTYFNQVPNVVNKTADLQRFSAQVNNVFNQCSNSNKNTQFQPNSVTTTQIPQFEKVSNEGLSSATLNKPLWMTPGSSVQYPSSFQTNEYTQFNLSIKRIHNDVSSINKPVQSTYRPLHQGLRNLTEINPSYKWPEKPKQSFHKDATRQNLITLNQVPDRQTQNVKGFNNSEQSKTEHVNPDINKEIQLNKDVDRLKKTLPLSSGLGSWGPFTSRSSTTLSQIFQAGQKSVQSSKPSIHRSPIDIKNYLTGTFAPGYESALRQNSKEVIVISDDESDNNFRPGVKAAGSISDTSIGPDYLLLEKYKHNPPSYEEMGKILEGFVLFFDVKNDGDLQKDPFVVIQDSFSKSDRFENMNIEETSQYDSFSSSTRNFCTLRWKGVMLVKEDGCSGEEARRKAGISLINTIAKSCYTIQTKYSYYCGGKLPKFMLRTPEQPGVYKIVRREEIIKAITETLKELKNQGINSYFAGNKGVDATHICTVLNFIDSFFKNKNNHTELLFGDPKNEDYTISELKTISKHAESLSWLQWRRVCGFGRGSYTAVSRRFTPQQLLQHLLGLSEESVRYRLLPPQGPLIDLLMADCQYSPNIIKHRILNKPEAPIPIQRNQNRFQGNKKSEQSDCRQWDTTTPSRGDFKRSWPPSRGSRGGRGFNKRGKWC